MKVFFISFFSAAIIFLSWNSTSFAGNNDFKVLSPDKSLNRTAPVLANTILVRIKAEYNNKGIHEQMLSSSGASIGRAIFPKELSIRYNVNSKTNQMLSSAQTANIEKAEEPLLRTYIVNYTGNMAPEKYCDYILKTNPAVEIAVPYTVDRLLGKPNDPLIDHQTLLKTIQAFDAWDICPGDSNVVIGISDIGVDREHEDLKNSIAPNWKEIPGNGIDDDGDGYVDDFLGCNLEYKYDGTGSPDATKHSNDHGTMVAGIAGATVNNGVGMAGTGGKCRIFPIKTGLDGSNSIPYTYESIIYAGVRGFKVLNCSWGSPKPFNQIDQSIIDYAVSRGVAIVAAAGNDHMYDDWYPAGYKGVLGVGEVDQSDVITTGTAAGWQVGVLAPGLGDIGTENDNSYQLNDIFGGTSWATPVVSGVVAIARSKHPELSPIQALEFVRQCTDDVTDKNIDMKGVCKGRINMLKAVEMDPFSIPGLKPVSFQLFSKDGTPNDRFNTGDTGMLKIKVHNYLGDANIVKFVLSTVVDPTGSISIIDSTSIVPLIKKDDDYLVEGFTFKMNSGNPVRMFFRVDIYTENNYHDFFLLPFTPSSDYATFSNDAIKFSMGDRGTFGFVGTDTRYGDGFSYRNKGNLIYQGGMIVKESSDKAESANYGDGSDNNDFTVSKPFISPNKYIGILDDSQSYINSIGVKVEQTVDLAQGDVPFTQIFIKMTNVSGHTLSDIAAGYFFDWDLGLNEDSNRVRLFNEALPATTEFPCTAEMAQYTGTGFPYVACAVKTDDNRGVPQAAGLSSTYIKDFSTDKSKLVAVLNTGTVIQFPDMGDISMVAGMKFNGEFLNGDERDFTIIIGADENKDALASKMKAYIIGTGVADNKPVEDNGFINISPQPANDYLSLDLNIGSESDSEIHLFNMMGSDAIEPVKLNSLSSHSKLTLDLRSLSSGTYFLRLNSGGQIITKPVVVVR